VNCLFRISSKGAAREDEIISGHAIDHELGSRTSTILLIFMLSDRKLGSGALCLVTGLSAAATIWNSPVESPDQAGALPMLPIGLIPSMRLVSRR